MSYDFSKNQKPPVGTLAKTHPMSYFRYFHLNSQTADGILGLRSSELPDTLLQIMYLGEGEVLAELIHGQDLKRYNYEAKELV